MYKGIPTLNFSETYDFLKKTMKILKNKTYFLSSPTGYGKSALIKKLADEAGAIFIDRRLANIMPEDISGLPVKNDRTNSVNFTPVDSMATLFDKNIDKPIFLFLDEFNLSSQEVLKAVFELVYDRTINGKPINENTYIFAAGNIGEEYGVEQLSPALKRRMNYIELEADYEDWKEFAKNDIPNFIFKYLDNNKDMFSLVKEDVVFSPAQWYEMGVAVKRAVELKYNNKFILNLLRSFVGETAEHLIEYFKKDYTLRDIKEKNIDYKTMEKDVLESITEDFINSVRNGNFEFYENNKQFVADFLLFVDSDIYINEFVNTIGLENLDGLTDEAQEKMMSYVS